MASNASSRVAFKPPGQNITTISFDVLHNDLQGLTGITCSNSSGSSGTITSYTEAGVRCPAIVFAVTEIRFSQIGITCKSQMSNYMLTPYSPDVNWKSTPLCTARSGSLSWLTVA